MFKINKIDNNGCVFLELINTNQNTKAIISLEDGGRLKELTFKNIEVVKEVVSFNYKDSFASSILFPFANRIENGKYSFNDKNYQFECNENGRNNALHGLVFDKKFQLEEKEIGVDQCEVTLFYQEDEKNKSFPFTYTISLKYKLTANGLSLTVSVKNTNTKAFPFTLGWHPYFFSNDLQNCSLNFESGKKIEFDKNLITKKSVECRRGKEFKIECKHLDDCFILNSNKVYFNTPKYQLEITSNSKENFLQLYTPKKLPLIAIEPMTGVSNSFNNKIGLQILEPNKTFSLTWNLNIST